MLSLYFIVEGQSEENFIEKALIPYLLENNNKFNYKCLNLCGGINFYKLIKLIENNIKQYDCVTTFIDLVRLNNAKFDNYSQIMQQNISSSEKANILQQQLSNKLEFNLRQKLIAHIQPYEFEALCFADADNLAKTDPKIAKNLGKIKKEMSSYSNPELINNHQLPAARLANYAYIKESSTFAQYCDINIIRACCPHFNQWLSQLEEVLLNKKKGITCVE
jgi:hypothetical protein